MPSCSLVAPPKGIGAINLPLYVSLYASDAKLQELALRIFLGFFAYSSGMINVEK